MRRLLINRPSLRVERESVPVEMPAASDRRMAAALACGLIAKAHAAGRKLSRDGLVREVRRLLSAGSRSLPPADLEAIVVDLIAATRRRRA